MPKYSYSGKDINDEEIYGFLNASSIDELESILLSKGIFLKEAQSSIGKYHELYLRMFKHSELTKSARQLNLLLKSGISLLEALDLTCEQIKDKHLREILSLIKNGVEGGKSLSSLLKRYPYLFDQLYVGMVTAGEISGDLSTSFDRIATYRENMESLRRKITSSLAYPFLVVLVAMLVVFALVIYVVPVFSSMYENFGSELPKLTKMIVYFSDWLRQNIYVILFIVSFSVILISYLIFNKQIRYYIDKLIMHIPILNSFLIRFITARFSRTMGSLLLSGVDIIKAYDIASSTIVNGYVNSMLRDNSIFLSQGKSFTETINSIKLFPNALLKLSASGEKTGQLGDMLLRASEYYEKETESSLQILTTLLEPMIIIILGVVVSFILIAMYLPLFELVGTI